MKTEILKSQKLSGLAENLETEKVKIDICGKTELKVTVEPGGQKMTGYIRFSKGQIILQAPLKKLDKIISLPMAENRLRENSKQAIYNYENMADLITALDQAV